MTLRRQFWGLVLSATGMWAAWGAGPALGDTGAVCWGDVTGARIWPAITFQRAADLEDYRRTAAQNRDQVRRGLEDEYLRLLRELALAGAEPEALADSVLSAILAFDELHDLHREKAADGMPTYLEVGIRTALDQLYRTNRIPADQRRLRFTSAGLAERVGAVRKGLRTPGGASVGGLEALREVPQQVGLVAYGAFSSDGAEQHVSLTLENLRTGSLCDFGVTASVEETPYLLAEKIFRAFQAVGYPPVRNPNPNLTWIRPVSDEPIANPEQARFYCASQGEGARLPYALELTNAALAGTDGASYVAGGIPRLKPGPWAVADRLEGEGPYFYFQPRDGRVDNNPAGAVRSAAGLGEVRARYWCVQGEPSPRISRIEGLYELHRRLSRADPGGPALAALQYLLTRERALSAHPRYRSAFADEVAARRIVGRSCFALEGGGEDPPTLAGLDCSGTRGLP